MFLGWFMGVTNQPTWPEAPLDNFVQSWKWNCGLSALNITDYAETSPKIRRLPGIFVISQPGLFFEHIKTLSFIRLKMREKALKFMLFFIIGGPSPIFRHTRIILLVVFPINSHYIPIHFPCCLVLYTKKQLLSNICSMVEYGRITIFVAYIPILMAESWKHV